MNKISDPSLGNYPKELFASHLLSSRHQFVEDIKLAIGNLDEIAIPLSLHPILQRLLEASHAFAQMGDESLFMRYFYKALEACEQGWNCLSCWNASVENDCYSIFWGLKVALEHYQQELRA